MSPFIIGFASIIPGLGLFLLNKKKIGVTIFLTFIFFLFMQILIHQSKGNTTINMGLGTLWLGQLIYAVKAAISIEESPADYLAPVNQIPIPIPPAELTDVEKKKYRFTAWLTGQLHPGEELLATLEVMPKKTYFDRTTEIFAPSMNNYWIGLTKSDLIFIEVKFDEIKGQYRIPLNLLKSAKLILDFSIDTFRLNFKEGKPKIFKIYPFYYYENQEMVNKINEQIGKNSPSTSKQD